MQLNFCNKSILWVILIKPNKKLHSFVIMITIKYSWELFDCKTIFTAVIPKFYLSMTSVFLATILKTFLFSLTYDQFYRSLQVNDPLFKKKIHGRIDHILLFSMGVVSSSRVNGLPQTEIALLSYLHTH